MGIVCGCGHQLGTGQYRDEVCPACGAIAIRERPCPGCGARLASQRVDDVAIETCRACGGLFIDHNTIEQLLLNRPERADAVVSALPRPSVVTHDRPMAICPSCGIAMEKRMVSGGAGIIVALCRRHGMFFEPGALQRMVAFVRREAREQAERERGDEALRLARLPNPPWSVRYEPPPSLTLAILRKLVGEDHGV